MRDVAPATPTGGAETALATLDQVGLDGLAGQLRYRHSAPLGFVAEPRVELVRELNRRASWYASMPSLTAPSPPSASSPPPFAQPEVQECSAVPGVAQGRDRAVRRSRDQCRRLPICRSCP